MDVRGNKFPACCWLNLQYRHSHMCRLKEKLSRPRCRYQSISGVTFPSAGPLQTQTLSTPKLTTLTVPY